MTLHVPETPATHGMIGKAEIAAMKPGAYLINNSRGTVVDLDALAEALQRDSCAARRSTSSRSNPAPTPSVSSRRCRA